jgi:cell division septation protein DedD
MKFRALCFAAPLLAAVVIGQAEARAPAQIDYLGKPAQMAALSQPGPVVLAKQQTRGALTSYGYGEAKAPASGPIIDLRGSFEDAPLAPAKREFQVQPQAPAPVQIEGPIDLTPPPPAGEEAALLGGDDSFAYAPPPAGLYLVQVGAFSVRDNAERTRQRASAAGDVTIDTIERQAGLLYRVRVGPWPSREAAERALATVSELGFSDARVTTAD